MGKTDVNTALAIFFLATAVVLIGGLVMLPTTTIQSASANHGERHGSGGHQCIELQGVEDCESGGGGTGVGGEGGGGTSAVILCVGDSCISPHISGGDGGGGVDATCTIDDEPVCERNPGGGSTR